MNTKHKQGIVDLALIKEISPDIESQSIFQLIKHKLLKLLKKDMDSIEIAKAKAQMKKLGLTAPAQNTKTYKKKKQDNTDWNHMTGRYRIYPQVEAFIHSPIKNPTPAFQVIINRNKNRYASEIFFTIEEAMAWRKQMIAKLPRPKARFQENAIVD